MGDYTKNNRKQDVKIGTCGKGYYTTFKMLEELKNPSADALHYLNKNSSCAFPFPQFDDKECGEISQFHEGQKINFSINIPKEVTIFHDRIVHHIHPKGGANGGVNLFIPCPYEEGANTSNNFDKDKKSVLLNWEMRKAKKSHIVCSCPYCGEENWFNDEEMEKIIPFNVPYLVDNYNHSKEKLKNANLMNDELMIGRWENDNREDLYNIEVWNRILKMYGKEEIKL